jgi:hypothetical protein
VGSGIGVPMAAGMGLFTGSGNAIFQWQKWSHEPRVRMVVGMGMVGGWVEAGGGGGGGYNCTLNKTMCWKFI